MKLRKYLLILLVGVFVTPSYSQMVLRDIGDYVQLGLPLTGLGISLATKDKEGTYQLLKSFAVQTSATIVLKRAINRKRPTGANYSFPSGHTSLSFMGSTFLWKRYGWKYGVPATLAAGFVGYSRAGIDDPVHHPSDVFAGAALGVLSSLLFTKRKSNMHAVEIIGDTTFVGLRLRFDIAHI